MNLSYTVTSKRKLLELINEGCVTGWDDPRMPTISGLRRRGYTPSSLKNFVEAVGIAKRENVINMSLLEHCIREDLNKTAPRIMCVLQAIKLTITNYPDHQKEMLEGEVNPEDPKSGKRLFPFSKHLYIEREDFKEKANRKFFRLAIGKEVRLKNAYIVKAQSIVKNLDGSIKEILCTYDPKSKSGSGTEESTRKVKGTLHWVSQNDALQVNVRLYERLFETASPDQDKNEDFKKFINPNSFKEVKAFSEPSLAQAKPGDHFQFQRLGYFVLDKDSNEEGLVFNKTVSLRETWSNPIPPPTL